MATNLEEPLSIGSEISYACGFRSSAHFSRSYNDLLGLPPSDDRKRLLFNSEDNNIL